MKKLFPFREQLFLPDSEMNIKIQFCCFIRQSSDSMIPAYESFISSSNKVNLDIGKKYKNTKSSKCGFSELGDGDERNFRNR